MAARQLEKKTPSDTKKVSGANPVDRHVGARLELRRAMLGISQSRLADAIGVKFPQVQKYEKGINRISASRLYAAANFLDVPISFFFDDMPNEVKALAPGVSFELRDQEQAPYEANVNLDHMYRSETQDLLRFFYQIEDRKTRKSILEMIENVSRAVSPSEDESDLSE